MAEPLDESIPEDLNVRRAARLTAWLGIVYSILVVASFALLNRTPGPTSSDEDYLSFYSSGDRRLAILAGLYLMPFAGIAFLWFVVALRTWISKSARRVDELFSNVQLVSGIVFIALFFASAATLSALAANVEFADASIEPATARQFTQLGWALLLVFSMRMAGIFVLTTTTLGRSHGLLPRWFTIAGYGVGLFLLLSAVLSPALILVLPVWVFVLGLILLVRARSLPAGNGASGEGTAPPASA